VTEADLDDDEIRIDKKGTASEVALAMMKHIAILVVVVASVRWFDYDCFFLFDVVHQNSSIMI
jgi:hypothetical protein